MRFVLKSLLVLFFLCAAVFGITLGYFSRDLPTLDDVLNYRPSLRTDVYDRHGCFIHAFYRENREWVSIAEIPHELKETIIAVEDVRFREHWGLDARRFFGAALKDILNLSLKEGGSTISQQLARNAYLHHRKTFARKIRELLLAIKLERQLSKDQILERYLNQIYFGAGCYGVGTVSKKYFGKQVSELNRAQSTFLAGLPKNPENYNPFRNLENGKKRHRIVLEVMVRQNIIEAEEADRLWEADLDLVPTLEIPRKGAHFLEEVRKFLVEKYSQEYGPEFVYDSGARIYTTLDLEWQEMAEDAFNNHFSQLDREITPPDSLTRIQGALLAMDPQTAGIVAMVGGRDYAQSQFNRAIQAKRQPGSVFKPFVYAEAIRQGYSPADVVFDAPDTIRVGGELWTPRNITRKFHGYVSLRTALNKSLNAATVRLLQSVGLHRVISLCRQLGITGYLPPYPSLALGTSSLSLAEMVGGFSVFSNRGFYNQPYFIEKIVDYEGNILEEHEPNPIEVLSEEEAAVMTSMLQSVIDHGSGYGARRAGFTRPAAGKTGTSDNYVDAWFVGYTPQVAAGVWVGYDRNQQMGHRMTGSRAALPLWTEFMKAVHDSLPIARYSLPETVQSITICQFSGQIACPSCKNVIEDVVVDESRQKRQNICTSCSIRTKPWRPNDAEVDKVPIN